MIWSRVVYQRSLEGTDPPSEPHTHPLLLTRSTRRYRRGKSESNDVDMVFTHPDASKVKGLCKRFVRRLHERGKCFGSWVAAGGSC